MHLPRLISVVVCLITFASGSPIAWPDAKLEEINAMRARGVSEVSRLPKRPTDLDACFPPANTFYVVKRIP